MADEFLYQTLDAVSKMGFLSKDVSDFVKDNLNPEFDLRHYQIEAFVRFFHCFNNDYPDKEYPLHFAFNMATGSGKTFIMAGLILYLYEKGYRNFLFFVNSTNIIEKTKDNFLNPLSSKHLFTENIFNRDKNVCITPVDNFEGVNTNDINICFTTIQKLHSDLSIEKENSITFEDFKDKKIILISDEAHHIQVSTRSNSQQSLGNEPTWENTVEKIFRQDEENILLEFTATLDYSHPNIADKYRNKVLFKYDLREYRNDRFSKDVYIVQADIEEIDRIIQALILSQYKQEVAAKKGINLKPVVLFKAQKTIAQSKENKEKFHESIDNMSSDDIKRIRDKSDIPIVKRAFQFFRNNNINDENLVKRLKVEFDESRTLSVNEEKEKVNYQLLINSLEDKNNRIRAIFAVQKLNEGWDVLNLFDIVRCYTTRDSKGGRPGKTTISEAQLIGRGARYFPFRTDDDKDLFRRKFDDDLNNELRVLEELHYHSINDSRYISELRTALIDEGMMDDKEVDCNLQLKEKFKNSDFYKSGIIYINERIKNTNEQIKSFNDFGVSGRNYVHSIATGYGSSGALLGDKEELELPKSAEQKDLPITEIEQHIIRNAVAKNAFFRFYSIKGFFPNLNSINEFIESKEYLGSLQITFKGNKSDLLNLTNYDKYNGVIGLIAQIENEIRQNATEYIGSSAFKPNDISEIFYDKVIKLSKDSPRAEGDQDFVKDKDWYVFNANYGTSEEKAFVRMLDRQMDTLKDKYNGIYLVRNERHFQLFNFADGRAFEPDFVLFLKGKMLIYQIFIEPKGKHLKEHDIWKQEFLKKIIDEFKDKVLKFSAGQKYRIIGVPFYNYDDENQFKANLYEALSG